MKSRRRWNTRGRLILVIGGASSGKSAVALKLAGTARKRAFVATGQALDHEMAERIKRHKTSREADWETAEVPVDLAEWFQAKGGFYGAIVCDCMTLWLTNLRSYGVPDGKVPALVAVLLQAIKSASTRVVVVTNELGLGLVPETPVSRRFRDLAGQVNQQIAREADEVYMVLSGLPVRLKPARMYGGRKT